jgi:hypothetical protein
LQHYGINLNEAASGDVKTTPVISGVQSAQQQKEPTMAPPTASLAPGTMAQPAK